MNAFTTSRFRAISCCFLHPDSSQTTNEIDNNTPDSAQILAAECLLEMLHLAASAAGAFCVWLVHAVVALLAAQIALVVRYG